MYRLTVDSISLSVSSLSKITTSAIPFRSIPFRSIYSTKRFVLAFSTGSSRTTATTFINTRFISCATTTTTTTTTTTRAIVPVQNNKDQYSNNCIMIRMQSTTNNNDINDIDNTNDGNNLVSKRGLRAVTLLPSYLNDARSIQMYNKDLYPHGALQLSVAETKLMQNDWLVPILNNNSNKNNIQIPADAIYYQPTSGRNDVKEVIASYVEDLVGLKDKKLNMDGLIIGAGCNAVLENLCFTLADDNDIVLLPTPYYAAFEFDLSARANLQVVPVTTIPYYNKDTTANSTTNTKNQHIIDPKMYYPTIESLNGAYEQCIQLYNKKPKILLLSHPMNPLGICYPKYIIKDCIEWCISKKIHCISDEIYAGSVYNNNTTTITTTNSEQEQVEPTFVSALKIATELASSSNPSTSNNTTTTTVGLGISPYVHWVYALSKDYALSGLRVGVAYTENTNIITPFQKLNDLCQISSTTQLLTKSILQLPYNNTSSTTINTSTKEKYTKEKSYSNPQQASSDETSTTGSTSSSSSSDDDTTTTSTSTTTGSDDCLLVEPIQGRKYWYQEYRIENHQRLQNRATKITQLLDVYKIPYLVPTAGLFVWINLSQFLLNDNDFNEQQQQQQQLSSQTTTTTTNTNYNTLITKERILYLELIHQYGILLTPGLSMKNEQEGFFRFVFTACNDDEYTIALQRFTLFLKSKSTNTTD